jgi:hypothetical protein
MVREREQVIIKLGKSPFSRTFQLVLFTVSGVSLLLHRSSREEGRGLSTNESEGILLS